jgi:hypothetical protein
MRKLIVLCCILLLSSTSVGQTQFRLDVEKTVLPNQLTLLTYVDTTVPTVSYRTFINAGSRDETKRNSPSTMRRLRTWDLRPMLIHRRITLAIS